MMPKFYHLGCFMARRRGNEETIVGIVCVGCGGLRWFAFVWGQV
jgi:hypothetical protein